jgi:two-component system sensor histidine kinase AgrC
MGWLSGWIDRRIAAYQREVTETHFAEVESMYNQMRAWRHDFRNHIGAMKSYAAQGDLAAVQRYLDELDGELGSVEPAVRTGNRMADAILNSKISLAKAKGIAVRADAHIPIELTTEELDLCAVIGNLFDNAIEASLALPEGERMIRVYMDIKGEQLYLSMTNFTAQGKRRKAGGRFSSTKGQGHGYGLRRIDAIVEKYGGYCSRNSEEGAFTTEILLPQRFGDSSPQRGD